jgi:hypothetical protein
VSGTTENSWARAHSLVGLRQEALHFEIIYKRSVIGRSPWPLSEY